jgi:AcrR family transcriptional regulator
MARQHLDKSTKPCTPRWQRRPDDRPEELIDAALQVFGERGFARARLEDVGRRAGVSKGTVYLYFDSKESLFREMVRSKIGTVVTEAEEFVRGFQGSTRELLVALTRRYWTIMRQPETARLARVVHAELTNFPELAQFYMDEVILRSRALIQGVLARGIARGEFRQTETTFPARALQILTVHLAQFQRWFQPFDKHPLSDEQVIEGLLDLYLHGVLARPEAIQPQ